MCYIEYGKREMNEKGEIGEVGIALRCKMRRISDQIKKIIRTVNRTERVASQQCLKTLLLDTAAIAEGHAWWGVRSTVAC